MPFEFMKPVAVGHEYAITAWKILSESSTVEICVAVPSFASKDNQPLITSFINSLLREKLC